MTDTPNYTPGQWYAKYNQYTDQGLIILEGTWETVAVCYTSEADTLLFAAAPDLLAALESLFENCVMIHKYGGEIDNTKQADAAIAAAIAAIAKATGNG